MNGMLSLYRSRPSACHAHRSPLTLYPSPLLFFISYRRPPSWLSLFEQGDSLICRDDGESRKPTAADCLTAARMIPHGLKPPDPDYLSRIGQPNPAKSISFELGKRKYAIPAIFRSGDCVIRV